MAMHEIVVYLLSLTCVSCQSHSYVTKWITQPVDHFNSKLHDTFRQRYLVNDSWWDPEKGPIFFYTGNEGDITTFWKNTGFVFEIAPQFRALVVFAEHRYYGKTMPYGPEKSLTQPYIRHLTLKQVLADFAHLATTLRGRQPQDHVVVSFGGSYGGMLSAWFRAAYPHVTVGAIAASAPILAEIGLTRQNYFFPAVTHDFRSAGCELPVRQAFVDMNRMSRNESGLDELSHVFKLCRRLTTQAEFVHLLGWVRNSFSNLAMFDYPYPTAFFGPLPAWVVNVACSHMRTAQTPVAGLAAAAQLYYGRPSCYDVTKEFIQCADPTGCFVGPTSLAWDYQVCTQLPMPDTSNNVTDMFPALPYNTSQRRAYCKRRWGVTPDLQEARQLNKLTFTSSNIVFSNGDLDPWHGGGVLKNLSATLVAVLIHKGAHHLDLRQTHPMDPPAVRWARAVHVHYIRQWTNQKPAAEGHSVWHEGLTFFCFGLFAVFVYMLGCYVGRCCFPEPAQSRRNRREQCDQSEDCCDEAELLPEKVQMT